MKNLTNEELVFLTMLVRGIANGLYAIDLLSDNREYGDTYTLAITLERKLLDELEGRQKEDM